MFSILYFVSCYNALYCNVRPYTSLWLRVQAVFFNYHVGIENKVK